MDTEQKKDYLNKYRILLAKISRLKYLIKLFPESSGRYMNELKRCEELCCKIEDDIDKVDGGVLSEILAEKYICGKTLEQIAQIIGYCKRQTERLHIKALGNFCIS